MGLPTAVKKKLPLFAALLLVISLAGAFFLRSPVLIVTDASFYQLYGSRRVTRALARNSLQLFRRVIPVPVSEQAGADVIALVVERASRSPRAVLFPQRYIDAAGIFNDRHPEVPVLVMWGRNPLPQALLQDTGLVFVRTSVAVDLYRAGLSAAVLAREAEGVLFFTDGNLQEQYREAFGRGLQDQGFSGEPLYLDAYTEDISYEGIGSVVLAGPAAEFLEQNLHIPVILFSWLDPARTPRTVKIVFNDSPLAQAVGALRAFPAGGEIIVPSRVTVISDRIEERDDVRKLERLIRNQAF